MSTNRKLQSAIHLALGLGAGALALSAVPSVFAQDAADQDDEVTATEEVVVTGSRIRRADIDSASPVTVLERDDIVAAGITDVGGLIQSMPAMSGSPIGTTTNNGGNGSVQIDLRGMGPQRTVLLVNGHRTVDGGDFQTIPATMIERVEILKDGASAVYGADAVAGVVNIITRRNFEGMEIYAQTADWTDAQGKQDTYGLITGTEFAGGNFVFGAEFVDQEAAFQRDTPWDFFQDSFYIYPLGCENQIAAPYDGTPSGGCYPVGSSRIPQSRLQFTDQGRFLIGSAASQPYEVGLMVPHDGRTYNYAPVNYIQTPFQRTNIFGEAHFEISDNVRFNIEVRGNFRESEQFLAPMPFNSPTDPAFDGVFEGAAFSGISQDNFYLRKAVDLYNATNGTSLRYEPIRDARRRMIETNRTFTQDITQYQFVGGLEGEFANDMHWEVFYNQGYRSRVDNDFGQFAGNRLANALGPSADLDGDGKPECYADINDPSSLIVGCVPFNFFGGGEVAPDGTPTTTTVTQAMVDYVAIDLSDSITSRQSIGGATLTGSNFELPGGEIGWAVGYGYWKQELEVNLDSNKTIDNVTGNTGANTQGSITSNSVFAEVLVPVFDNGAQSLVLKGGLRYDEWDAFRNDETYQVGLEFNVIPELKVRGTYGTVFRTPTISNLFGGQVDNFPTFTDPCASEPLPPGCDRLAPQFDSQVLARVGGNPFLQPETGDTLTAGFVYTPEFGNNNVTLTFDYWEIDLKDGISSLGVDFILDDCYLENNQASCDLVTRRSDYTIAQIIDGSLNVSRQGAKGYDTELHWSYNSDVGQWQASVLWAHLLERTKTPFEGADEEDLAGRHTDPTAQDGGSHAKDKVSYTLQWLWNDFSVGYLGEYISGQDSATVFTGEIYRVPSQFYHDLVASYNFSAFGSTTTIAAGITNFTDEAPPFIDNGFNAKTDPSTYRLFGRGYYVRLGWKF